MFTHPWAVKDSADGIVNVIFALIRDLNGQSSITVSIVQNADGMLAMRWDGDYLTVWNKSQAEQGLQAKTIRSIAWNKEINVTAKNELAAHAPVWIVWIDYKGDVALTH